MSAKHCAVVILLDQQEGMPLVCYSTVLYYMGKICNKKVNSVDKKQRI
jgi:hypothetical protein